MNWETLIHLVRPVRLWSADPSQSRRASWMELFFDLIFVAAVAQVGVPLGEDYTLHRLVAASGPCAPRSEAGDCELADR